MRRIPSPLSGAASGRVSRIRAAPIDPARDAVAALLSADRFDEAAIVRLAERATCADATRALFLILRPAVRHQGVDAVLTQPLVAILYENIDPALRLWRLARKFGVVSYFENFDADAFRKRTSKRARLALAANGELPDWRTASREERAAYVLNRLVAARRASAS